MTFDLDIWHTGACVLTLSRSRSKDKSHRSKFTVTGWKMFLFRIWMHVTRRNEPTVA